ncbi:MAG TPA: hypothetical protein VN520_04085 [Streptomyces sp.]|uniref:hypothetical protein n=1 Tax=Streptomyces sp. TaxID=1931 RepID=UPI002BC84013|nr:hypothetical protein [Streptomyces sp.]HWU05574.1 hypothetical protein [Streptomyces sp.]
MRENHPIEELLPLLADEQTQAYARAIWRQACTDVAEMLARDGLPLSAGIVEAHRDLTELDHPAPARPERTTHKVDCRAFDCRCGCPRAQDCSDCQRCMCWRSECCAEVALQAARRAEHTRAVRALLPLLDPQTLTAIRESAAEAEESAWRRVVARRMRTLVPGRDRYTVAIFKAVETKLGMSHAGFVGQDVELYAEGQSDPNEAVDLDDGELARALGALSALLRPAEGHRLVVDLYLGREQS